MGDLPAGERAARYRELADRHIAFGDAVKSTEARAAHLELAALWTRLAGEADRRASEDAAAAAPGSIPLAEEELGS